MLNVTYLEDSILSSSIIQSRLNGGFLIQKILADSAACAQDFLPKDRKMMIYSGDSVLFVGVLKSLGLWKPHVPKVSSALIFEFWKNLENEAYEIKAGWFNDFASREYSLKLSLFHIISHDFIFQWFQMIFKVISKYFNRFSVIFDYLKHHFEAISFSDYNNPSFCIVMVIIMMIWNDKILQVFHDLGETNTKTAIPMTIPGCKKTAYSTGCRFDYLVDLLINILPGDDESICGKSVTEIRYEEEEVSVDLNVLQSDASRTYYGVSVISCVLMLTKLF